MSPSTTLSPDLPLPHLDEHERRVMERVVKVAREVRGGLVLFEARERPGDAPACFEGDPDYDYDLCLAALRPCGGVSGGGATILDVKPAFTSPFAAPESYLLAPAAELQASGEFHAEEKVGDEHLPCTAQLSLTEDVATLELRGAVYVAPAGQWRAALQDWYAPRRSGKTTVRNAPCPCGSGHKYKKCCGF